jgi:sugar lactone lactonase YvrE
MGDLSNQLNNPQSLAFDNDGHLYVSDSFNNRIQMFNLIENQPCSPASSGIFNSYLSIKFSLPIIFYLFIANLSIYR